jgi:hypothetical protein
VFGHITTYEEPFPISDLPHLANNWHSRMMKCRLRVIVPRRSAADVFSASIKSVIETLGPRQSLTEEGQIMQCSIRPGTKTNWEKRRALLRPDYLTSNRIILTDVGPSTKTQQRPSEDHVPAHRELICLTAQILTCSNCSPPMLWISWEWPPT